MPSPYLMASLGTLVVGGGGLAATFLGISVFKSNKATTTQQPEKENHTNIKQNNYLVFFKKQLPTNKTASLTCILQETCHLFNWDTKLPISANELNNAKPDKRFVLNVDESSLKAEQIVEVAEGNNKYWFSVQSAPTKDKAAKISPVIPANLITKADLKQTVLSSRGLSNNLNAIQAQRYYNMQEETFITRNAVDHQEYLILKWEFLEGDSLYFYTDTSDGADVDKYIFKTINEQLADSTSYPKIQAFINDKRYYSFVEIYEIKNQATVEAAITSLSSEPSSIVLPDWNSLAKENVMVTKLTHLEKGKYYKFVLSNFSSVKDQINKGFNEFGIDLAYSHDNSTLLFELNDDNAHHYCVKFSDALTSKCGKFVSSD